MDQITAWKIGIIIFKLTAELWFIGAMFTFLMVRVDELKGFDEDYRMDYQDIIFKWPVFWYEAFTK